MKYQRGPIPAHAFTPADLTDGDRISADFDWSQLLCDRVVDENDAAFAAGYRFLSAEFDPRGEMEARSVLAERLKWDPSMPIGDLAMLYEMLVIQTQEEVAAVRDHTAIVNLVDRSSPAVVHLSHVLIDPSWRGTGLGAWLRALPIDTARACLRKVGVAVDHPIVLACEMEHPSEDDPSSFKRLRAYERAGFLKVDPAAVNYHQPDFDSPAEIDAKGGPVPLPMALVVRRVGREGEMHQSGAEVRAIVSAIYGMFALGSRAVDMKPLWEQVRNDYPADDQIVKLISPTQV